MNTDISAAVIFVRSTFIAVQGKQFLEKISKYAFKLVKGGYRCGPEIVQSFRHRTSSYFGRIDVEYYFLTKIIYVRLL